MTHICGSRVRLINTYHCYRDYVRVIIHVIAWGIWIKINKSSLEYGPLDLAICFRGRSLDTIERHLQQAVNAIQEWATRNGFKFTARKCKVIHFTAPRSRVHRPPAIRIGNTFLPVEESTKFLGLWWDSHLSFKKHISVLKTQCREGLNLIRVVAHLKWGGDRDTLLMMYRAIVRSKLDYGCIVYGWHSIEDQFTTTGQHSQLWIETGIGSFLYQPNFQPVHRGQWNFFGGTSVEAIHALLSENSCLRWQPSIPCLAWIWPNH